MLTSEQIIEEIKSAMTLNKDVKARCNEALTHAMSLIMHEAKELQSRFNEEYRHGMNDAWEIARELCKTGYDECAAIFGDDSVEHVIKNHTPLKVKEMIDFYREEKEKKENEIVIGSVIRDKDDGRKATVLELDSTDDSYCVYTEEGVVEYWDKIDVEKSDGHVDVYNVLIK